MTVSVTPLVSVGDLVDRNQASIQTGPFGTQLKASEYVESGIPVINVRNIGIGTVRQAQLEYVNEAKAENLKAHKLNTGDIVFGRKGAVDRHILITPSQAGWIQGSDCIRLRFDCPSLSTRFVSHYFRTLSHRHWMEAQGSFGATMASLNQGIIKRIAIPDIPYPAQRKIAAILTAYDDLIENNRQRVGLLEKMAEEIYREWFVRLRFPGYEHTPVRKGVPEEWRMGALNSLCTDIREGVPKRRFERPTTYVGLEHIPRRKLILNSFESVDAIESNKFRFHEGDILFGKIRPYLHKVAVADFSGICSTDTIVIRPSAPDSAEFLLLTVASESFIDLATTASKGTKMPRADWQFLSSQQMKVPSDKLLSAFHEKISPVFSLAKQLTKQNSRLGETRDLLLNRLISGKLRVDDLEIQFPPSMQEEVA